MELPITMKRRDGEGNFTVLTIATNDIGIVVTTQLPGKKFPKQTCEGFGTLKATVEDRITEIVNQKLSEGFFSSLLDGAAQALDFFTVSFRDQSCLRQFLDHAHTAGVLKQAVPPDVHVDLHFDGFIARPRKTITGIEIAVAVPRAVRHHSVPIFYAMTRFAISVESAETEGESFDLRTCYLQQLRSGPTKPETTALLELTGMAVRSLTASQVGRGRGTRFTVTL
ncbi:hypothetical protein H8Z72_23330 (plasmid) [Xanthomonas citri pv. citri]|uniref:hypothetical protein n=1 Tax=Xanthomonas citri TaxID=346 RepID=UPI00193294AC|nr:hypothetical protein [Xanthomonas citri]QRD62753.1 hypothetical protein H8Z74_22855 [Xanthomonas citri pv. citri]QRD67080.1 hypothetical protein H8Z73_22940 [Xanthomonas citri pv. citri]QRD71667.1 hypothetical protein H8Z72_23330 [Xanthomonas citri pv. citri]